MTTKTKVIIVVTSLVVAFAAGRYTVPVKVITETKIVEVEKKTKKEEIKKTTKKKTTIVDVIKPNGEKQTTTVIDQITDTDTKEVSKNTSVTEKEDKKQINKENQVTISALAGIDHDGLTYGASVYKPILGPIGLGIFGLTNKTVGCSVGISF